MLRYGFKSISVIGDVSDEVGAEKVVKGKCEQTRWIGYNCMQRRKRALR